jgi:hypothetical protein
VRSRALCANSVSDMRGFRFSRPGRDVQIYSVSAERDSMTLSVNWPSKKPSHFTDQPWSVL